MDSSTCKVWHHGRTVGIITSINYSPTSDSPQWKIGNKRYYKFCSKSVWEAIHPAKPTVPWASLTWHKGLIPKHDISVWLFILNRNPTLDRLASWGLDVEVTCLLCGSANESRNHLFFECSYTRPIWGALTQRLRFQDIPYDWESTLKRLYQAIPNQNSTIALLQVWQAIIYEVCKERNKRYDEGFYCLNE